jgi:hypothetical protein
MIDQPQQKITWNLAPDEAQFILNVLSERPLREVMNLFNKCAQQSQAGQNIQMQPAPDVPDAGVTEIQGKAKEKAKAAG